MAKDFWKQKRIIHPLTAGLCVLLFLILISGSLVVYNFAKQKNEVKTSISQDKIADSTKNVHSVSTENLATLENKDSGYIVKYPANFDVIYTQDGVEFTPKNRQGKIILQVNDGLANISTKTDQVSQSELSMLNEAVQTIKSTFQATQSASIDKASNEGRFANIHFDPKKY